MTTHEQRRLAALHEYRLLDAPAGDELEAVARVAATVAGVPTATLNLIDENRQCQLTTTGFEGGDSPRSESMCAVRFETGELTYLPDARLDPEFRANPWVTGARANVRFYASVPLITPQGYALGSLCVFHDEPRELTADQIARLMDLAAVILALFERRRQARVTAELAGELQAKHAELQRAHAERATVIAELSRSNTELEQALTDLAGAAGGATVLVAPGLPVLDADPTLIRQLLQNLIGNAFKYRHPDRACRVGITAERRGAEWLVAVADNGPGIPADQRARVFEMFARVDPSSGSGHGVGLSTCQRIVERHGGRITATETPGGGTIMTFSLPGAGAGRPRRAAAAAAS